MSAGSTETKCDFILTFTLHHIFLLICYLLSAKWQRKISSTTKTAVCSRRCNETDAAVRMRLQRLSAGWNDGTVLNKVRWLLVTKHNTATQTHTRYSSDNHTANISNTGMSSETYCKSSTDWQTTCQQHIMVRTDIKILFSRTFQNSKDAFSKPVSSSHPGVELQKIWSLVQLETSKVTKEMPNKLFFFTANMLCIL